MPAEIAYLLDHPLSLVVVLFVGALFGMMFEQSSAAQKRAAWKARKMARGEWVEHGRRRRPWGANGVSDVRAVPTHDALPLGPGLQSALATASRAPDAADQLRIVMASEFKAKRLLNRGESRVLAALEPLVTELLPGWRVCAQVSLGEVLEGSSTEAFNTINAKRVDFLLVDETMRPRHAIEYQGQGHHQGAAAARDAVKKEALRRAGVGYGEVFASDTPAVLRAMLVRMGGRQCEAGSAGERLRSNGEAARTLPSTGRQVGVSPT